MADCPFCGEPVLESDKSETMMFVEKDGTSSRKQIHYECQARSIVGSVAHQQKRCSCYGGEGSDDEFPSKRIAALAALAYFRASGDP
jgi:hypothetical protein